MSIRTAVLVAAAVAAGGGAEAAPDLREEVRRAEAGFAKSMADRDHAAFASYLAEDAVFFGGKDVQRGKAAVAAAWKPLFEKTAAPFSWEPAEVEVLDSGGLAMTSGPVYDPAGKRVGTFNSVWRREKDGSWKVVLDKGCPPCDCGTPAAPARPSPAP
jgi:uncharacterized protein (TIGR02246 family)